MARIVSWAFAEPGSYRFAITFAYPRKPALIVGTVLEFLCCGRCRGNWFAVLFFTCQHCHNARAVLWATATAVTLVGLRAASASSQGRGVTFLRNNVPTIALAPWIRSARRYRSPPLLILSIRSFFPLACIHGVNPSQAAKCRADRN